MNKKNIRIIIVLVLFIALGKSFGQTVIYTETFNSGGAGWQLNTSDEGSDPNNDNAWIVNNSYAGVPPLINNTPNQFLPIVGAPQSSYLHIHYVPLAALASNSNFESSITGNVFAKMNTSISTVGFTNVSFKFWHLAVGDNGSTTTFFGRAFYSTNGGTSWIQLPNTFSQIPDWTQANITNPAFDNQANLRFAFQWVQNPPAVNAVDPSFSIDDIVIEGTTGSSATITTGVLPNATICAGATFNVPFTTTGTFNAGNQFTAELSDASGSFAAPTTIGTGASSPISVTIPGGTTAGTGYLIRVVSSNPAVNGTASVTTLTINASQAVTVSLTADATSVCPGATVNFTATPGQTLTNATYVWTVGGTNQAGQTTSTLSAPINTNNTIVQVTLTTTDACFSPATATANVTISTAGQPFSVTVTASDDTICAGDNVTFVATTSPAVLTNATYTWFVNNIQQQTGASASFSTSSLTGLSSITVTVNSTDPCLSNSSATSTGVQVLQQSTPLEVNITVFPNNNPCPGAPLEFTANVTPANLTGVTYQWLINGNPVAGQVLSTFNTTTYADGDLVTVEVITNNPCVTGSPATSNIITLTYSSGPEASVTAVASQLEVCSGTPVTFTASPINGGVNPTYTWLINGAVVGSNNPTFVATGLQVTAGMLVQVVMQSSETCVTNNPDTADVTITVIQKVQPTAVLSETVKLCSNSGGRIIATVTPPGGILRWTVNGTENPVVGVSFYTDQSNDGDIIGLIYENIPGCVFVDSIVSNNISVQLRNAPIVSLGEDLTITYGDQVPLNAVVTPANSIFTWVPATYLTCATAGTNCLNPSANPTDTLNVLVLVAADPTTGCTNSDTLNISVKTNYDIFIPTAFSPNGDGNNDVLYVRNPPKQFKQEKFLFRIYNEYGEKVFESEYKEFGWDGKYRDKFAMPGVYVYHLTGLYSDDKPIDVKGKFLLMK